MEVEKVKKTDKQRMKKFHIGRFDLKKLNGVHDKEWHYVEISNRLPAFQN
jgi:hypothetical protein